MGSLVPGWDAKSETPEEAQSHEVLPDWLQKIRAERADEEERHPHQEHHHSSSLSRRSLTRHSKGLERTSASSLAAHGVSLDHSTASPLGAHGLGSHHSTISGVSSSGKPDDAAWWKRMDSSALNQKLAAESELEYKTGTYQSQHAVATQHHEGVEAEGSA